MFLLAVLTAGVVTSVFAAVVLPLILTDMGQIRNGEPTAFRLDDHPYDYSITVVMNDSDAAVDENAVVSMRVSEEEAPEAEFTVTTADGTPIEIEPEERWTTVMEDSFQHMARFSPVDASGVPVTQIVVTVDADPSERFVLFRHPESVWARHSGWALSGWIASGVLLVASSAGLLAFFAQSSSDGELDPIEDPAHG
ncbi:MAG: hypothetical protein AAGG07_03140 [Planctomycetota bacterium]